MIRSLKHSHKAVKPTDVPCCRHSSRQANTCAYGQRNWELALWRGRAVQPTPGKRSALFERSEFAGRRSRRTAAPVELAPAEAGGHATTCMLLATFAEIKVARRPGRDQALPNAKIKIRHEVKDEKAKQGNSFRGRGYKNQQ